MAWATYLIGTLFLITCVLLIVVVLLQRGRGGGLGAAFGSAGSSAFGTRTGDVFTWVTIILTGLFLVLAVVATFVFRQPPGTTAPPMISPQSHETTQQVTVTIQPLTTGAKVYYTVDKSTPTDKSIAYTKPFPVDPGTTLKAISIRAGWQPSEEVTAEYPLPGGATAASAPAAGAQPALVSPPAATQSQPAPVAK